MRKVSSLIALGVGAYLVFAIATLPATLLLNALEDSGVSAAGVEGTVWRGQAQIVRVNGTALGRVAWDLHALALLKLQLKADVKLTRSDGFAQCVLSARSLERITLDELTASMPLSALPIAPSAAAGGTLNAKFSQLTLEAGWPVAANGSADVINVSGGWLRPPARASYRVVFPAPGAEAADALVGAINDLEGPLQISGTLRLMPNRSYYLDALVAARPDAPSELKQGLQILGEPDAQGRRRLTSDGTL